MNPLILVSLVAAAIAMLTGRLLLRPRLTTPIRTAVPSSIVNPFVRTMHIQPIPMRWKRGDNYAYVVVDQATKEATIIDPAEPQEVLPELHKMEKDNSINLTSIINTHYHYDHAGGNEEMLEAYRSHKGKKLKVIGGKDCPAVDVTPAHMSHFNIGQNIKVTALHTPCHTQDSICYFFEDKAADQRAVFTGDTLFIGGCGRFFEGTAEEMAKALTEVLASLPDDTRVYPGHEYTRANVKFIKTIIKDNPHVERLNEFANSHEYTTGQFTIADEKKFNPFMMIDDVTVQHAAKAHDRIQTMHTLRELKNKM